MQILGKTEVQSGRDVVLATSLADFKKGWINSWKFWGSMVLSLNGDGIAFEGCLLEDKGFLVQIVFVQLQSRDSFFMSPWA